MIMTFLDQSIYFLHNPKYGILHLGSCAMKRLRYMLARYLDCMILHSVSKSLTKVELISPIRMLLSKHHWPKYVKCHGAASIWAGKPALDQFFLHCHHTSGDIAWCSGVTKTLVATCRGPGVIQVPLRTGTFHFEKWPGQVRTVPTSRFTNYLSFNI